MVVLNTLMHTAAADLPDTSRCTTMDQLTYDGLGKKVCESIYIEPNQNGDFTGARRASSMEPTYDGHCTLQGGSSKYFFGVGGAADSAHQGGTSANGASAETDTEDASEYATLPTTTPTPTTHVSMKDDITRANTDPLAPTPPPRSRSRATQVDRMNAARASTAWCSFFKSPFSIALGVVRSDRTTTGLEASMRANQ
jgi:hypothetical protein